jgi:hypothetical protein
VRSGRRRWSSRLGGRRAGWGSGGSRAERVYCDLVCRWERRTMPTMLLRTYVDTNAARLKHEYRTQKCCC